MKATKRQPTNVPWRSLALVISLTALFAAYLLIKPGNPAAVTVVDNVTQVVLEGVGLFLTFPCFLHNSHARERASTSLRSRRVPTPTVQRWVPRLLGLGLLSHIIGQTLWTYNEDIAHLAVLFPSWADVGCLSSYLFLLLAILLLPTRSLPAATRTRIALDGLMIMVGTVTFSWYFILGPTITQETGTTVLGKIVGAAYPLAALVLVFCLLLLLAYPHDREIRPVIFILSLALITIVITNSIYHFQEIYGLYHTGTLLDVGWPLGDMLVGLGARTLHLHLAAKTSTQSYALMIPQSRHLEDPLLLRKSLWRSLLPYFSVPAVVLLLVYTRSFGRDSSLAGGVDLGATILIVLLLLRQILTIQEMISDNQTLWLMQQEVNTKSHVLFQVNRQFRERSRQYEQQRQLNELKDQFLLNVSHELRTPLTMLGGSLELLDEHREHLDTKDLIRVIKDAQVSHEELVDLVNRVLDATTVMSEIPDAQPEVVHVHRLVQEALAALSPLQAYTIRLQVPEQMTAWTDPQLLSLVLRNLLTNIIKYVPTQTEITISASQATPSSPVRIELQDAGPGIPPEELPLLFEKFVRLKRDLGGPIRGTGLGLYICKRLVEEMGGQIWVESSGRMGEGSRFCLTLSPYPPL